jgi:hypothetical protein
MTERAVRQGWPISDEKRAEIVRECLELALHASRARDRIQAMRVLLQMDSINVRRERNDQDAGHQVNQEQIDRMRALLSSTDPKDREAIAQLARSYLAERTPTTLPPPPALPEKEGRGEGC